MFAKLSTVCVAGALILVAGSNAQAQDFWGNWGARPTYNAAPVRHTGLLGMGILPVGPAVNSNCPNGQCGPCVNGQCATGNCANGRCNVPAYGNICPNGQCAPNYGYGTPVRPTTYAPAYRPAYVQPTYPQPAYRAPAYNTGYQPVRPTSYNGVNSPFYN